MVVYVFIYFYDWSVETNKQAQDFVFRFLFVGEKENKEERK